MSEIPRQGDETGFASLSPRRLPRITLGHAMALVVLAATASKFYVDAAREQANNYNLVYNPNTWSLEPWSPWFAGTTMATILLVGLAVGGWRRAKLSVLLLGISAAFGAHLAYATLRDTGMAGLWLPGFVALGFALPSLVLRGSGDGGPGPRAAALAGIGLNGGLTVLASWLALAMMSHMATMYPPAVAQPSGSPIPMYSPTPYGTPAEDGTGSMTTPTLPKAAATSDPG